MTQKISSDMSTKSIPVEVEKGQTDSSAVSLGSSCPRALMVPELPVSTTVTLLAARDPGKTLRPVYITTWASSLQLPSGSGNAVLPIPIDIRGLPILGVRFGASQGRSITCYFLCSTSQED